MHNDRVHFLGDMINKKALPRKSNTKLAKQFASSLNSKKEEKDKIKLLKADRSDSMKSSYMSDIMSFKNLALHKVEEEEHSDCGDSTGKAALKVAKNQSPESVSDELK